MTALVRKNLIFEKCINNIDEGMNVLAQLEINKHYIPNIEFQPVDNGSMVFSVPNIAKPQPFIAAFDLDWTLVGCEHKLYPGSASAEDIVILPGRREILTALVKSGYTLAIFTNQRAKTPKPLKRVLARITKFLVELGLPCYVFVSTGKDNYRKPDVGMWRYLQKLVPHIEYAFYVGDAAGRLQDFSDSDIVFASNIEVQFYTPEEFFLCQTIPFPNKDSNLVVLVGAPGSGKSTAAKELGTRGYTVISLDKLGGKKKKYFNAVKESLKTNILTVADATNGLQADRDKLYKYAHDAGRTVSVLYMLRAGRGWSKLRDNPIPDVAYHTYYKRMTPPTHANTLVISELCPSSRSTDKCASKLCSPGEVCNPDSGKCKTQDVASFLESIGLGAYAQRFEDWGIEDMKDLEDDSPRERDWTDADLRDEEIGMTDTEIRHLHSELTLLAVKNKMWQKKHQESTCFLKTYNLKPISKETIKILQSASFTVRYSRIGGIIDIRPKATINVDKLFEKVNKNKWWTTQGSKLRDLDRGLLSTQSNFGLPGCKLLLKVGGKTICKTLYGNMVKVKQLLKQIGSPYTVHIFNVETEYNGFFLITSDIPANDRCILAISARRMSGFGHYMLAVLEGSTCYFFDSLGAKGNLAQGAIKALKQQPRIKKFINVYTLNPTCYKTTQHQHDQSMFCSVWSSCLALLIGLNPTKKVKDVFTYFAYKAPSRKYLDQKIRLFLMYLLEKGADKLDRYNLLENTDQDLLRPKFRGRLCESGPPTCDQD